MTQAGDRLILKPDQIITGPDGEVLLAGSQVNEKLDYIIQLLEGQQKTSYGPYGPVPTQTWIRKEETH